MADKTVHQVTDGLADSISPAFDAGGKYLYFLASTNYGPSTGWLEMSFDRSTGTTRRLSNGIERE
jgi:tricorn protease